MFLDVVASFDRMSETRSRLELTSILSELFRSAGSDIKNLVYLMQGKLAPDYAGIELGLADNMIMDAISRITGENVEKIKDLYATTGDLGTTAGEMLVTKPQTTLFNEELTVERVHSSLMSISKLKGSGSSASKTRILMDLLLSSTSKEARYLVRIALGKIRLGVSDATILSGLCQAFAPDQDTDTIELGYNFHPDLGEIAVLLQEGHVDKVISMGPTPFIPARVMLAERLPEISGIIEKMEGPAAFEYKYDGLRSQIHILDGNVVIYSRSSENTTESFPDIVDAVRKTFDCKSCILDGEAVPYNPETGELYPFQMVSLRRGRIYEMEKARKDIPVTVFLFDILYLNGRALNNLPYSERRAILESAFKPNESLRLASRIISSNTKQIADFMDQAISDGCEGLVAKKIAGDSIYRAGARGWLWIKLKKDYQSEFSDSLDLVVIGAFHGHGRRKGTFGALLMATYNKEDDTFESICKLGTGFSDDLLMKLPEILSDLKQSEKPARVVSDMIPDVWIYPGKVMEIIGAEITISPVHRCAYNVVKENSGLAVRFPRFTGKFRDDKTPETATSTAEVIELFRNQKKKS